ncbi:hypothetical protein MA16_Dca006713 [Dendrobium catenatum]|uniref:Uncharacterized protein n=1 Tax=Dendrobium catenatum TaxID=906689 RepID=A0A2I0W8Z3_9ASPA|nr:hypothetical protein MA16_Dca006713 [Dendrobium catenatum]
MATEGQLLRRLLDTRGHSIRWAMEEVFVLLEQGGLRGCPFFCQYVALVNILSWVMISWGLQIDYGFGSECFVMGDKWKRLLMVHFFGLFHLYISGTSMTARTRNHRLLGFLSFFIVALSSIRELDGPFKDFCNLFFEINV